MNKVIRTTIDLAVLNQLFWESVDAYDDTELVITEGYYG